MAVLDNKLPPGHYHDGQCYEADINGQAILAPVQCASWEERDATEDASLAAIPEDKLWCYPVADGLARYYVRKLRPLTLSLIPVLDVYRVHPAMIRGLRVKDIKEHQAWERRLRTMFERAQS